jgi:hypothetical protein
MFSNFRLGNRSICDIIWEVVIEPDRPQSMRYVCGITKVTDTQSECVILIAFPLQLWLRERALMLRYTVCTLPLLLATKYALMFSYRSFPVFAVWCKGTVYQSR